MWIFDIYLLIFPSIQVVENQFKYLCEQETLFFPTEYAPHVFTSLCSIRVKCVSVYFHIHNKSFFCLSQTISILESLRPLLSPCFGFSLCAQYIECDIQYCDGAKQYCKINTLTHLQIISFVFISSQEAFRLMQHLCSSEVLLNGHLTSAPNQSEMRLGRQTLFIPHTQVWKGQKAFVCQKGVSLIRLMLISHFTNDIFLSASVKSELQFTRLAGLRISTSNSEVLVGTVVQNSICTSVDTIPIISTNQLR